MRIMKGRKTMLHNELVVEVIKLTRSRGVLPAGDIKANIDKSVSLFFQSLVSESRARCRVMVNAANCLFRIC